ncbi:DUF7674 family protein [Chryseobacterium populi]|uniref:DUF7674 domain-containing protein n=1 Tax=Chryseobacterium populi TaxID=1144316 RepID=J2KPM6_9FLAO|nr:hypothetical protein [Chryseobacterium populi]EJL75018.1 hypothetical protein PMI13_00653 [Chryseobacterium populi]
MDYLQAAREITKSIPEIQNELRGHETQNSFSVIRTLTDHIKNMVRQNEKVLLIKSIKKMNAIYKNGDALLKNAVESTFIYSLDSFTAFCNEEYKKTIFRHISQDLQKVYSKQIYQHGM